MQQIDHDVSEVRCKLRRHFRIATETDLDLILSALTEFNPYMSTESFRKWLKENNDRTCFDVKRIRLREVKDWILDRHHNLRHVSGKFFSIEGIHVRTNNGHVKEWSQPIIYQPEVGILGILCQKRHGILYFLMQAKIEPGNINKSQLSPTVQATKSNYTQVHGGKKPPYLEYFINLSNKTVLVDQFQSEQGARFLKKRNRNMIVEVDKSEVIPVLSNYCWLTLGQIKSFMQENNIVNMDSRTVFSCTQIKCYV